MLKEQVKKIFSKPPTARKGEVNHSLIDRFTFVHFMIGVGYGWFELGVWTVVMLALIWELVENPLKVHLTIIFPHSTADTLENSLGDCVAVMFGWLSSDSIVKYGAILAGQFLDREIKVY